MFPLGWSIYFPVYTTKESFALKWSSPPEDASRAQHLSNSEASVAHASNYRSDESWLRGGIQLRPRTVNRLLLSLSLSLSLSLFLPPPPLSLSLSLSIRHCREGVVIDSDASMKDAAQREKSLVVMVRFLRSEADSSSHTVDVVVFLGAGHL